MAKPARPSRATVLVVESQALICLELAHQVARLGSVVLSATDSDEAVALLEARPDIQLLIIDIRIPGSMDGFGLAHHVRDVWPTVKIIVTSGMVDTPPSGLPKRSMFITKPYTPQEVWTALSCLMPASGPQPPPNQAFLPF